MIKKISKYTIFILGLMISQISFAEEAYRYLHVTIDTPWMIFLFLLCIVLFPFVLMAILYWYFAYKKAQENKAKNDTALDSGSL